MDSITYDPVEGIPGFCHPPNVTSTRIPNFNSEFKTLPGQCIVFLDDTLISPTILLFAEECKGVQGNC